MSIKYNGFCICPSCKLVIMTWVHKDIFAHLEPPVCKRCGRTTNVVDGDIPDDIEKRSEDYFRGDLTNEDFEDVENEGGDVEDV